LNENYVTIDVAAGVQAGNKCYYGLTKPIISKFTKIVTKNKKTVICGITDACLLILLYGPEIWLLENIERK